MRELPHDFDAEQAVLGALMAVPAAFEEVSPILRAEHFADPLHGRIFAHVHELHDRGRAASPITLKKALNGDTDLERAGGAGYLASLMTSSLQVVAPARSAQLLVDLHRRREAIRVAEDMIEAAHAGNDVGQMARNLSNLGAAGSGNFEGLPLRFWADLGETSAPDRLVRRLLGTSSLAMLYGEPGCGKSFLACDLGLHIALGRKWFGRSVTRGAVIYVAGEGVAGISNRLAGFRIKHEPGADVPFVVVPMAVNLGPEGEDAPRVVAAAKAIEARTGRAVQLVIVDTLARAMGHGDENTSQDMGIFIAACDRIRHDTGATVLIVHHRGKSSQAGARGSSALLGAVDTAIEVEKHDSGRVAKVVKQKDAADGLELGFDLEVIELGQDDEDEAITTCVVVPTAGVAKRAPTLSAKQKRAMDVLRNVIVDFGENAPNSVTFPNVTVVKVDRFREGLKSARVTDRDTPANERTQWRRIVDGLADKGVLAMRDDYCWACDKS